MSVRGNSLLLMQLWRLSLKAGSGLMLQERGAAEGLLLAFRLSHPTDYPWAKPPSYQAWLRQGVASASPDEEEMPSWDKEGRMK